MSLSVWSQPGGATLGGCRTSCSVLTKQVGLCGGRGKSWILIPSPDMVGSLSLLVTEMWLSAVAPSLCLRDTFRHASSTQMHWILPKCELKPTSSPLNWLWPSIQSCQWESNKEEMGSYAIHWASDLCRRIHLGRSMNLFGDKLELKCPWDILKETQII